MNPTKRNLSIGLLAAAEPSPSSHGPTGAHAMTSLRRSDLAASRLPLLLAAALVVAACGGSSPDPATPGGGGGGGTATVTAASRGVVTAVGALTVNGIAFDAST